MSPYDTKTGVPDSQPRLVRAIGRWSLTLLAINSVIGSGVFGLPSLIARYTGRASPLAVLIAGALTAVLVGCFAEVASRFSEAGGPYLYARVAFGRLVGLQVGWMLSLAQATAVAANANLFVIYLADFWPGARAPVARAFLLTGLIGFLTLVNIIGVKAGTEISNFFTIAKLVPLVAIAIGGCSYLVAHGPVEATVSHGTASGWMQAFLVLVFIYGGFEAAFVPMSEARDPQRDSAFALFTALLSCAVLYVAIQWVVVNVLAKPAGTERPLADVARVIFGPWGGTLVSIGALVSLYGYISAKILAVPRIPFALAERGDLPAIVAAIHPRFHTPCVAILIFSLLTWGMAFLQNFEWNVTLSAVARLFYYGVVCAALPVLRERQTGAAAFVLPAGPLFSAVGILICLILLTRVDFGHSLILIVTAAIALLNWLWARSRRHPSSA